MNIQSISSLDNLAEFIAARRELARMSWQVFDLSAASEMIYEMHRQYDAAGEWNFSTPLPAPACVFWDGEVAIMCQQRGDRVSAWFPSALQAAEIGAAIPDRAQRFIDSLDDDPERRAMVESKLGAEKLNEIREMCHQEGSPVEVEFAEIGQPPEGTLARCAAVWSEFIGFPIAKTEAKQISRPTRRRLARLGVDIQVKSVSLSPRSVRYDGDHSPGEKRALHFCRGHWRKSNSARARPLPHGGIGVWVDGHWRGDPEKGVVLHNYVASVSDMDKRAALIC